MCHIKSDSVGVNCIHAISAPQPIEWLKGIEFGRTHQPHGRGSRVRQIKSLSLRTSNSGKAAIAACLIRFEDTPAIDNRRSNVRGTCDGAFLLRARRRQV